MTLDLDRLEALTKEHLVQCGPCDFGLVEYGCTCPKGDPRPVMSQLLEVLEEVRQLRGQVAAVGEANIHLNARLGEVKRERDLAVAHDRQPYPTAHAYEAACAALEKHRQRADLLEAQRDQVLALCDRADDVEICQEIGAMGRVSSREIRAIFSVSRTPDRQDEES